MNKLYKESERFDGLGLKDLSLSLVIAVKVNLLVAFVVNLFAFLKCTVTKLTLF